jgi:hypothetical protein
MLSIGFSANFFADDAACLPVGESERQICEAVEPPGEWQLNQVYFATA